MNKKILIIGIIVVIVLAGFIFGKNITGNVINSNENTNIKEINMDVDYTGYSPNSFVLKKGIPVKWNINVKQLTGCNSRIISKELNIDKELKKGLNVIEFTPDKERTIIFTCGMNMLKGSFIVTESGTASQQQIQASTPKSSGSCSMGANGGSCGCGH